MDQLLYTESAFLWLNNTTKCRAVGIGGGGTGGPCPPPPPPPPPIICTNMLYCSLQRSVILKKIMCDPPQSVKKIMCAPPQSVIASYGPEMYYVSETQVNMD